jgi:hypothetical protein
MVRTFLKVYMELSSYFLFLQEQIKDIIIISGEPLQGHREANEYHMQKLDIAKEVGDRAGESQAYGSQRRLNEHDEVVVWYKAELAIFKELGIVHMQAQARWVWEWPCG